MLLEIGGISLEHTVKPWKKFLGAVVGVQYNRTINQKTSKHFKLGCQGSRDVRKSASNAADKCLLTFRNSWPQS